MCDSRQHSADDVSANTSRSVYNNDTYQIVFIKCHPADQIHKLFTLKYCDNFENQLDIHYDLENIIF